MEFQRWLYRTITEGVNLGFREQPLNHTPPTRTRSDEECLLLGEQYATECALGRTVLVGKARPEGPLFQHFYVSPMYTIPKKRLIGQPQKWRLIHNLSFHCAGRHMSVNEGISNKDFPVTYPSVTTAAHLLFCEAPDNSVIWGRDMTTYYRHLMINPACWWLTGSSFGEAFYFDCYCPFGARSMPAVFQRLTDAIRVVGIRRAKCDGLVALLDDFLGVTFSREGESYESVLSRAGKQAQSFDHQLLMLGLKKNKKKDMKPSWVGIWLGIRFDMRAKTISIPVVKIRETCAMFFVELTNQTGTIPTRVKAGVLQTLIGKLSHMSSAWVLGKILL